MLEWGDHAPWFRIPALSGSPSYAFDTVAGRHVLLLFHGSAANPESAAALAVAARHRALFDDFAACFFGVTTDPEDAAAGRIAQSLPGIRHFLDYEQAVSRAYGAVDADGERRPHWLLLDPSLRVIGRFALGEGEQAVQALRELLAAEAPDVPWAPVLTVSNVLEPELCRHLIGLYETSGGEESGFMRDVGGKTVLMVDPQHKQRRDHIIEDESLRRAVVLRMNRRLNPALERAFQFRPTRIERYLVACYEAGRGHFRPHRDNTTKGTAHRRFAVTINLNAGDYEGGDLRFPEYGPRTYRAPTGGAVVFSCSLLHEATPVTRGRRYAFLPFLYDEAAARVREANNPHLGDGLGAYRMGS
ncbi:2OG-Fe(II) oxygenase [Sphingosinicella terrae]|uniref:2OG-Fe(II) oxygenase n=1 Tax=Sphingosinicella terrae TaxID=2172047 RepID=UPI000E0D8D55|nr:2OG-Fe(II) oxygenase [Sphingosinicella terrae]